MNHDSWFLVEVTFAPIHSFLLSALLFIAAQPETGRFLVMQTGKGQALSCLQVLATADLSAVGHSSLSFLLCIPSDLHDLASTHPSDFLSL